MTSQTQARGTDPVVAAGVRLYLFKMALLVVGYAVAVFWSAGTVAWPGGWWYLALIAGTEVLVVVVVGRRDPGLLAERSHIRAGTKRWDPPLYIGMGVAGPLAMVIVSGLDERFGWIGYVGPELFWPYLALATAGCLVVVWSMLANPYFSGTVRIQTDRGHRVADTGPYRLIRHPGYLGALAFTLATPYVLGSRWAVFPAAVTAVIIVVRTALEDRTLRDELDGYAAYAQRVRYRLLPPIW